MNRLYLDCDGVLADFDQGFRNEFELDPNVYEEAHGTPAFWKAIRNCNGFFEHLPLMLDARELFSAVEHLRPVILTGCPFGNWAELQKMRWRNKHFSGIPMVTCVSKEKRLYCKPGDILVDDLLKYKHLWEEAGGVFVHHTSAESTIEQLLQMKVL